jgi:hypothetical protein
MSGQVMGSKLRTVPQEYAFAQHAPFMQAYPFAHPCAQGADTCFATHRTDRLSATYDDVQCGLLV